MNKTGAIALDYFRETRNLSLKKDQSPVTQADREIEKLIRLTIQKTFPTHNIVGEEFEELNNESEFTWIVDPIDGTKNYINGNENFCSMISLVEHSFPIASFIYKPLQRQFIYAFKDIGAYIFDVETKISTKLNLELDPFSQIIGSGGTKGIPEVFRKSILSNLRSFTKRVFLSFKAFIITDFSASVLV